MVVQFVVLLVELVSIFPILNRIRLPSPENINTWTRLPNIVPADILGVNQLPKHIIVENMGCLVVKEVVVIHSQSITSHFIRRRLLKMPVIIQGLNTLQLNIRISNHTGVGLLKNGVLDVNMRGRPRKTKRVSLADVVLVGFGAQLEGVVSPPPFVGVILGEGAALDVDLDAGDLAPAGLCVAVSDVFVAVGGSDWLGRFVQPVEVFEFEICDPPISLREILIKLRVRYLQVDCLLEFDEPMAYGVAIL